MTESPAATRGPGWRMAEDMAGQPAVLRRLLNDGAPAIAEVAAAIAAQRPRFVLFVARGSSDHAALYAKYLAEIRLALVAGLASPSTITVYDTKQDFSGVLVVGISQSGGSPDLVKFLETAGARGATTVAVTNAPASSLNAVAQFSVDVAAGTELAVAATKTYTAELASARYRFANRLVLTGRGYAYPTAREAALKLMETSYLGAQAFSGADLLHGPLAMADSGLPVLGIVTEGPGGQAMAEVLERIAERGADLLVVGPKEVEVHAAQRIITPAVDEAVAPILDILPLQSLARHLAVARGDDPDTPRGLHKVTETL